MTFFYCHCSEKNTLVIQSQAVLQTFLKLCTFLNFKIPKGAHVYNRHLQCIHFRTLLQGCIFQPPHTVEITSSVLFLSQEQKKYKPPECVGMCPFFLFGRLLPTLFPFLKYTENKSSSEVVLNRCFGKIMQLSKCSQNPYNLHDIQIIHDSQIQSIKYLKLVTSKEEERQIHYTQFGFGEKLCIV